MRSPRSGPGDLATSTGFAPREKDKLPRAPTDVTHMYRSFYAGLTRRLRRPDRDKRLLSGHGQCLDFHHETGIGESGDEQQRRCWRMLTQQSCPRRAIGTKQ